MVYQYRYYGSTDTCNVYPDIPDYHDGTAREQSYSRDASWRVMSPPLTKSDRVTVATSTVTRTLDSTAARLLSIFNSYSRRGTVHVLPVVPHTVNV